MLEFKKNFIGLCSRSASKGLFVLFTSLSLFVLFFFYENGVFHDNGLYKKARGDRDKGNFFCCEWENKLVQAKDGGQRYSTAGKKAHTWHITDLGSIPNTAYSPSSIPLEMIPEQSQE